MDTSTIIVLLVLAVGAGILLSRGKKSKPKVPSLTRGNTDWRMVNSPGTPASPEMLPGGGWRVGFGTSPDRAPHAVAWYASPSLVGAITIRINFSVTGGEFIAIGGVPALVGLMFQRKGDDWQGNKTGKASHRFYSPETLLLTAGENQTLTATLSPDTWTNVDGKHDPAGFIAAMHDMEMLAVTVGHPAGRAHGVFAAEPDSQFTLLSLDVI